MNLLWATVAQHCRGPDPICRQQYDQALKREVEVSSTSLTRNCRCFKWCWCASHRMSSFDFCCAFLLVNENDGLFMFVGHSIAICVFLAFWSSQTDVIWHTHITISWFLSRSWILVGHYDPNAGEYTVHGASGLVNDRYCFVLRSWMEPAETIRFSARCSKRPDARGRIWAPGTAELYEASLTLQMYDNSWSIIVIYT